jgi:hypothetical protein
MRMVGIKIFYAIFLQFVSAISIIAATNYVH